MPQDWGHDPEPIDDAISDNVVVCPKCETTFLEVGPMKIHFKRVHDIAYDEWKANLP